MEALRERARIIVEVERAHPSGHKYHRWMHIVQAADTGLDSPEALEWEGITGRLKQLHAMQDRRIDAVESKLDAHMREVKDLLTALMGGRKEN